MRCKIILIIFIFSYLGLAHAKECGLEVALRDPKLANNSQFWEEYSKLKSPDDPSEVAALLRKYGHEESFGKGPRVESNATKPGRSLEFRMDKKAEKEVAALPDNLRSKVDEFVTSMTKPGGVLEVRNNPGRYHLERLAQFGDTAYSVRLNDGYRVLFDLDEHGFTIRRVNKGQIHGN